MDYLDRVRGILHGSIPNRLTPLEIQKGTSLVTIWSALSDSTIWTSSRVQDHWLTVLLFKPLKKLPTLIHHPSLSTQTIVRYRLEIGK